MLLPAMADIVQRSRTLPLFFQEPIMILSLTKPQFLPSLSQRNSRILFLFGPDRFC